MRYSRLHLRMLAWQVLVLQLSDEESYVIRLCMFAAASGRTRQQCEAFIEDLCK